MTMSGYLQVIATSAVDDQKPRRSTAAALDGAPLAPAPIATATATLVANQQPEPAIVPPMSVAAATHISAPLCSPPVAHIDGTIQAPPAAAVTEAPWKQQASVEPPKLPAAQAPPMNNLEHHLQRMDHLPLAHQPALGVDDKQQGDLISAAAVAGRQGTDASTLDASYDAKPSINHNIVFRKKAGNGSGFPSASLQVPLLQQHCQLDPCCHFVQQLHFNIR